VEPLTVTVTNTGTNSTGNLTVELSGGDYASFDLDRVTLLSINPGATRTFEVKPNTGLAKKTYTTDVLVYNDSINGEFSLSFTVWDFTSAADLAAYLNNAANGTTVNNPVPLPINHGVIDWAALAGAINTAEKNVALDISTSSPAATSIEDEAFLDCAKLVSISFPAATVIGKGAFVGCRNLISVSFPAVVSIGQQAFGGCTSLTEINLPASLTSIGSNPFTYCINLTTITVDSNNPEFSARNGMLLDKAGTTLYGYPSASGTVTVSGITSIEDFAFMGCDNLISASFPQATSIGFGTFMGCANLTSVSCPVATSTGQSAFSDCASLTSASFPQATSIGMSTFSGCASLSTASFPQATSIEQFIFDFTGGTALTITLGNAPPTLEGYPVYFDGVDVPKTVTVRVPSATVTAYDTAWQNDFKGGNTNINLTIQGY
jgi:hypothetical protein